MSPMSVGRCPRCRLTDVLDVDLEAVEEGKRWLWRKGGGSSGRAAEEAVSLGFCETLVKLCYERGVTR